MAMASGMPTSAPAVSTGFRLPRARRKACPTSGGRGPSTANANTALRKKQAIVRTTTPTQIGITTGPLMTLSVRPRRTWAFRS